MRLSVNSGDPVSVLVIDSTLLGFDLLHGMDIIKNLGRICIKELGEFQFSNLPICAALRIDEPDFSAKFNQSTKAWTALWKWSENNPSEKLQNWVSEYLVSKHVREKY